MTRRRSVGQQQRRICSVFGLCEQQTRQRRRAYRVLQDAVCGLMEEGMRHIPSGDYQMRSGDAGAAAAVEKSEERKRGQERAQGDSVRAQSRDPADLDDVDDPLFDSAD